VKKKNSKGQSILEYTLILGVVIGIVILVVFRSGGMKSAINDTYNKSATAINTTTSELNKGVFKSSGPTP